MSEFKAQILGLIIVIGLFALVSGAATDLFSDTMSQIETYTSQQVSAKTA